MELIIKEALKTSILKTTGRGGGGCINEGEIYHTDNGKVFIKQNSKSMDLNWGDKNIVVVGDSRVDDLKNAEEGWKPKNLVCYSKDGMNMEEAISKVERVLDENVINDQEPIDFIVIMVLHCDFTKLKAWKDTGCKIMIPNTQLNIPQLVTKIKDKLIEWKTSHSYCQIIITVPYIPNFGRYNSSRLCRKLDPEQVKNVYPYRISKLFIRQMRDLINEFFECWDRELTPRPLALSRIEYLNHALRKNSSINLVRAFQGSTKDGFHFVGATVGQCWKLIKIHHFYLNKYPGKTYQVPSETNPSRSSLERQINQLSVQPRIIQGERSTDHRRHIERSSQSRQRPFKRRQYQPTHNCRMAEDSNYSNYSHAGPSGIHTCRRKRGNYFRNNIRNRQHQSPYTMRSSWTSHTERSMTVETRTFFRTVTRRY
ncbi:hypothetical protein Avbf_06658 [Armadillidium vulgare]|nr:hypothetical protein Avbf_06658 [Armadillidium vulgare]